LFFFCCRVSPEHPFPASLEDTIDSILWIHSNPSLYNFNIKKVSCGGNSAGAGLALSASHSLGPERICALALLYPPCDFSKMDPNEERLPPSKTFRSGFKLDHKAVLFLEECYLLDNVDRKDPKLNPMYANTMDFPKRIILATGTGDPIYVSTFGFGAREFPLLTFSHFDLHRTKMKPSSRNSLLKGTRMPLW